MNDASNFNKNTRFDIRVNDSKQSALSETRTARNSLKEYTDSFRKNNEELKYVSILKEALKYTERLDDRNDSIIKTKSKLKQLDKEISQHTKEQYVSLEDTLKLNEDIVKAVEKAAELRMVEQKRMARNITDEKQAQKIREKAEDEYNDKLVLTRSLLEDIKDKNEELKKSQKSMVDAFGEDLDKFKNELKDLAVVKGVGDITAGIFDKNSSMMAAYTNTRAQLGITSHEFNVFKNDLTKQLINTGNIFEFGWKDTAEYMSKLGELNITSQEMAEQQYIAVLQGSKYLGLQTDTQAKLLKLSKDTGKADLLQATNETMVQIMNAQLGISKEQLNQMVSQAADLASMSVFLGGNGDAARQLEMIQASITKEYGKSTSDAAMNILNEIMRNPANNQYLSNGFIASEYSNIVNAAQNGNMDEALKLIVQSVKNSRSTDAARGNIYAANALGADSNIMAIANSSGSMANVDSNMAAINAASSDIATTLREFNKSWSDKILNAGSNILSMLPFSQVLNLQNAYYALALTQLLIKMPVKMTSMLGYLKKIDFNTSKTLNSLDNGEGGIKQLLSGKLIPTVIAAGLAIASIAAFASDYKKGKEKSSEWGTSKTASALGGLVGGTDDDNLKRTLKNAAKYAAAGAAIGIIVPGVGNVVGAVVGGLIGMALGAGTGAVGGENWAKLFDSFGSKAKDSGSPMSVPVTPKVPAKSNYGKGEPLASSALPWPITSPFGYRGSFQCTDGTWTNPYHNGLDLGAANGTPLGANNAGTVVFSGVSSDGANAVIINSGDGYEELYWHMRDLPMVKKGDTVREGQQIGFVGATGGVTGPHLHFGLRHAGTRNYIDPINSMNSGTFYPTETGYDTSLQTEEYDKDGQRLLEKVISADTLSNKAASVTYGKGSQGDIINCVNGGFAGLNNKLEELANRQDSQEQVLRRLTAPKNNGAYQY